MSAGTAAPVSLERILARSRIWDFLRETARFYESRLVIRDAAGVALRDSGASPGAGPAPRGIAEQAIIVFGHAAGSVGTVPRRDVDRPAAAALAGHAARLLTEVAEREYELDDLSREILDSYEEVNLFYDVGAVLSAVHDVEGVCAAILAKACEIVKVNRASILLIDESAGELYLAAAVGIPAREQEGVRMPLGRGISGRVLETRVPQLVDDVRNLPRGLLTGYETYATRSFISVPLCVDAGGGSGDRTGRAIGVINMTDRRDGRVFTAGDLKLLRALASQAAVMIENMRLVDFVREMRIARRIQRSLLPGEPLSIAGFEVAGALSPAANLGGDYFDYLPLRGGCGLAVVVADVSGHSVGSALQMAVVRALLRCTLAESAGPAEALRLLNARLCEDLEKAELFVSLLCCFVDTASGAVRMAKAGHPPAMLLRRGAAAPSVLDPDGLLVGIERDVRFEEIGDRLGEGDAMLLYTDGVVEAADPQGRRFGRARLSRIFAGASARSAAEAASAILEEARVFSGCRGLRDDVTAVVLKRTGPAGR